MKHGPEKGCIDQRITEGVAYIASFHSVPLRVSIQNDQDTVTG